MKSYDIIFIGGGPAGYAGAIRAAQKGKNVLLIEKGDIGGTCLNRGCIPTKAIIASIKVAESAKNAHKFGIRVDSVNIDFNAVQERKEHIITIGRAGIGALLKKWKVDLKIGNARLLSECDLEVIDKQSDKEIFNCGSIIITTGSSPVSLPTLPLDNVNILNSDAIHGLKELPKSLLIVGGGVIGCEFAYIFNSLGVDVSIVEMLPNLLPLEDNDSVRIIEREFKKRRIKIYKNRKLECISKNRRGYTAEFSKGETITAEKILVSIGRRPNIYGLDIEKAGIEIEKRGNIPVNAKMETTAGGVYAAGDVTGSYPLAYVATHEGIIASENSAGGDREIDYNAVPRVVFTEPELGSVGLSQSEAELRGINIKVGKFQIRALGRSQASGEAAGHVKVICDAVSEKIIGIHIVGPYASEIVHVGVMAIKNGIKAGDLGTTFFAHPVFSEALLEASWDVRGESIHTY